MNDLVPVSPISPLRQRLIDDMNMRHFSRETQRNYVRDVGRFATYLGRPPDTATAEDLRRFQVEQREAGMPVPTMNAIVAALRFFFIHTLDRPDLARRLVRMKQMRKLPVVLSRDEVARLLGATTCLKHQAALSVAYGAGLRVGEVAMLKVRDIDSERMLLRVERGKGGQYRNAMLPADLLTLLRVVYAKPPFAGPQAVLAYLSRYTHRVAISNSRLIRFDGQSVTFRYKDYRRSGSDRQQVMTLPAHEFIRRFLLHVLPTGFHRIRHYGLLAGATHKANIALARKLLAVAPPPEDEIADEPEDYRPPCPHCGGHMIVIETFARWQQPRAPPTTAASTRKLAP